MTLLQKIRNSLTTQLALWVMGFVLLISGIVVFLLIRFSRQVVIDETAENIQQMLGNVSQRISNTILQSRIIARLDKTTFNVDKSLVEDLIQEGHYMVTLSQMLPHAILYVTDHPDDLQDSSVNKAHIEGDNYIFYQPISLRQHSMTPDTTAGSETYQLGLVISCPISDIYDSYLEKYILLLLTAIIGVLLLLFVCCKIMGWFLRPLNRLDAAAQQIANGQFITTIPKSRNKDEIGRLQNSLAIMQQSLTMYMNEMEQKRDELKRQNEALQQAYAEAQEYEKLKDRFILQMADEMTGPVDTLCRHTDTIQAHCQELSTAQMAGIQTDILAATEQVTNLLDKLLNAPSQKRTFNIHKPTQTTAGS